MRDDGQDYAALQAQVRAFVEARQWQHFHSPKNLAMALIVEAAELVEHFQWATEDESGQLQPLHSPTTETSESRTYSGPK